MTDHTTPPWPEERYPTAAEWVAWFLDNDERGRLAIASKAIGSLADINHCLSSGDCWINR
jgi:hypothetical protein